MSEALDAASAVCAALELVLADDPHGALEVAETAINAVDLVVQESQELDAGDPLLEAKILAHPLMQQELARQERDLSELATLSQGDAARLAKHRQRAGSESALSV